MTQHERAREFQEAAARLRVDSDWQKLADMIRIEMADLDNTLRNSTDHDTLMQAQGAHRHLQELIDFVDNAQSLDTRKSSGRGFAN